MYKIYQNTYQPSFLKPKPKHRLSKKSLILIALFLPLALIIGFFGYLFIVHNNGRFNLASLAASFIKTSTGYQAPLKGQNIGRTNILIYGMTKDGLRTDSIVLVSYYWNEKKLVTLNIPRDLYVYDGCEDAKMGEVYAYAVSRQPKNNQYPSEFVASIISKEYNINIDYWVKLNMQGEVDFINAIGGIDVNVPNSFTDYAYPTWDYSGYVRPAPHFDAGLQHMNGDTALVFSRSRHSLDSNEGSDFARSARQALVIRAVAAKIKSLGIVGNLADIDHYLTILSNNVDTNMSTDEMLSFAKTAKYLSPQNDFIHGNWSNANGFLCDGTSSYRAYILLYGTQDDCGVMAGSSKTSIYRKMAIYYVQNLLISAQQSTADFINTAKKTLGNY